jgi:hypothetical protein
MLNDEIEKKINYKKWSTKKSKLTRVNLLNPRHES